MIGRGVRRWNEWLAVGPGTAEEPGRIETLYRNLATSISRHPTAADTALAGALAGCTVPELVHWSRSGMGSEYVLVFTTLLVAPLIWRRRFPLSTFAFVTVVGLVQWIVTVRMAADAALLVYLYTVASRYPIRVGVLATTIFEVGTVMAAIRWPQTQLWIDTFVLMSGPVVASLLLGVNVRHRRNSLSVLTERAEQLERERDQQAEIAAAAERTRIAREMHDVVAHSLSVMVTLSEGAVLKQAAEPERANSAMRQVSVTGRQALDEMRRLLGVLRTEDAPGSRQPQPGIAQIDGLIDQVRATGLAAELTVTGTPTALSPGAGLTVYRIVQEALTNTLKHAAEPSRIRIAVVHRPDSVMVDVHDDGARGHVRPETQTARREPGHASGHGLAGMRERAAVYGGAVSAGPDPAGGWHIHAHLPLTASVPTTAPGRTGTAAAPTAHEDRLGASGSEPVNGPVQ